MTERQTEQRLFDNRAEGIIHSCDVPFVQEACNVLGNVEFKNLSEISEEDKLKGDIPILAPKGFTWIKMRADLSAGQRFDFVFEKATQLKQDSENIIKFTNPYLSSSSDKPK